MRLVFLGIVLHAFSVAAANNLMLLSIDNPPVIGFVAAIESALKQNPQLKQMQLHIDMACGETLAAMSSLVPRVSLRSSYVGFNHPLQIPAGDQASAGLFSSVPLLDAKAMMTVMARRQQIKAAEEKYRYERDMLIEDVGRLYIDAAIAKALADNAYEEAELYKAALSSTERKFAAKRLRAPEIHRARYMETKAYSDYVMKNQDYLLKMGELGQRMDRRESFLLGEVAIASPYDDKSDEVLFEMARKSADMTMIERNVDAARNFLTAEQFEWLPKINLTADAGWRFFPYKKSLAWPENNQFGVKIMLNIDVPLSFAMIGTHKIQRAKLSIEELNLRSKQYEKDLGIVGIKDQLKSLAIVKTMAEQSVAAASAVQESTRRLYEKSEASSYELVEANNNHFAAKNLLATTILKLEKAKLHFLTMIGKAGDVLVPTR